MEEILNLGVSATQGGMFGLLGTALGRVFRFFERRQDHKFKVLEWGHELKLFELQMKQRNQEAEIELAITQQHGSWQGLQASIDAESKIGKASQWVVDTLRLVRPGLTLLLWVIVAIVFAFTRDSAITEAAVFASVAATLWWFGDRAPQYRGNEIKYQGFGNG